MQIDVSLTPFSEFCNFLIFPSLSLTKEPNSRYKRQNDGQIGSNLNKRNHQKCSYFFGKCNTTKVVKSPSSLEFDLFLEEKVMGFLSYRYTQLYECRVLHTRAKTI